MATYKSRGSQKNRETARRVYSFHIERYGRFPVVPFIYPLTAGDGGLIYAANSFAETIFRYFRTKNNIEIQLQVGIYN